MCRFKERRGEREGARATKGEGVGGGWAVKKAGHRANCPSPKNSLGQKLLGWTERKKSQGTSGILRIEAKL